MILLTNPPAHVAATITFSTSLVDIGLTILDFLSLLHEAMDGRALLKSCPPPSSVAQWLSLLITS